MRTVTLKIEIPAAELADVVAEELSRQARRNNRSAKVAQMALPTVATTVDAVVTAMNKLDNAQHTRGEQSAVAALIKAAKQLRIAVRVAETLPKGH